MKYFCALWFCSLTLYLSSQPGQFFFGADGHDFIQQAVPAPDGNVYLIGSKAGETNQSWLQKINTDATVAWSRVYEVTVYGTHEYGYSLRVLTDGSLLICGQQENDDFFNPGEGFAMKVDADGNLIWKRFYPNSTALFDGISNGDGYLLAGWHDDNGASSDGLLLLVDGDGALQYRQLVNVYHQNKVKRIFPTDDGNFILLGRANTIGAGPRGVFLRKIRPNGAVIWQKAHHTGFSENYFYSSDPYAEPLGAVREADGGLCVVNPTGSNSDILLMKFSAEGDLLEQNSYGSPEVWEYPYALTLLPDGSWLIVGSTSVPGPPLEGRGFAMKVSPDGREAWRRYYRSDEGRNRLFSCLAIPGGKIMMAGMSNESPDGSPDGWLLRAESNGNILPWKVRGTVVFDVDNDCMLGPGEPAASGWFARAQNTLEQILVTDSNGQFTFYTDDAETEFTVMPADPEAWNICANALSVISNSDNPDTTITFLVQAADGGCPRTEVSLTQPSLVRCDTATFYVTVANRGIGASGELLLSLELDPALRIVAASEPYSQDGTAVHILLPHMQGLVSRNLEIRVRLDCDVQLGATHPIVARIGPAECLFDWPGPEFRVKGQCTGDMVRFELQNVGGGGAGAGTQYQVLADYLLVADAVPINLPEGGASQVLEFPADGRTWRVELQQAPGFPLPGRPAAVVEGCGIGGNGLFSTGYYKAWKVGESPPESATALPVNTSAVTGKVAEEWQGLGRYHLIGEFAPAEFTAKLRNPLPEVATKVEFHFSFSPTFDIQTFRPLAAPGTVELALGEEELELRASITGVSIAPGETAAFRFRIHPRPGLPPDANEASNLLVRARSYFNGSGPYSLAPGFLNYSALFPEETAPYYDYPPGILEFGSRNLDFGTFAVRSEEGAVFLSGESTSYSSNNNRDGLLIKADRNGRAYWLSVIDFGDAGLNTIRGVAPLPDDGCLAAGNYIPPGVGGNSLSNYHAFLARIDGVGHLLWHKKLRPAGYAFGAWASGIIETENGRFIIYGHTNTSSSQAQFYLCVDAEGNMLWQNIELNNNLAFWPQQALTASDGGAVFGGSGDNTDLSNEIFLQKISGSGNSEWIASFLSDGDFTFSDFAPAPDGGFMVLGYSRWELDGQAVTTPTFIKVSSEGEVEWEKNPIIGDFNQARAFSIIAAPTGGYFIGGDVLVDTVSRSIDMLLLKMDENGDALWWRNYGSQNIEWVEDMLLSTPGRLLLWGYNQSRPPTWSLNAVLVRTAPDGNLIAGLPEEAPISLCRALAFPNPAREQVNVLLSPVPSEPVCWRLYNVNGQLVKQGREWAESFSIGLNGLRSGVHVLSFPGSLYPARRVVVMR